MVGDTTVSRIRGELKNLDEPFNPHLREQRILGGIKRIKPERATSLIYQELKKGFPEICMLEDSGECGEKVIRAHSLQEAVFKHHSKKRHVYQFEPFTGKRDEDKNLWPELAGIHEVTTFLGFCEHHDSKVFSPIETRPFQNTLEQRFLFHYRAFAQMYYDKAHKFQIMERVHDHLAKKFGRLELDTMEKSIFLNRHDTQELKQTKIELENQLRNKDWSAIEGYAFVGEKMPDVLTTNYFAPLKNFHGKIFQDTKSLNPIKWISFTVTAVNDRAVFLLCGEKGCPVLKEFASSFREMPLQSLAIVTYVFCTFENFIMLPKWWDSLPRSVQLKFVNAFQGRFYRRELPSVPDWNLKEIS